MSWPPVLLLLQLQMALTAGQVPTSDFYPYGSSAGDSQLPRQDDVSIPIPIQFDFPFFDSNYRQVHISTNGQINFGQGDSSFVPRPFPLNGSRSIASYWVDSHPGNGGDVHFRESVLPALLDKITDDIRSHFVEHRSFVSRWALVVTFDHVSGYACNRNSCHSCNDTLTYQTILTSNGIQSFVIFKFNSLMYPVTQQSCIAFAQVGFNAGDGKRFYLMPSSNTHNVAQFALTNSNVGIRGKWMFTVDGSDIAEGCNDRGLLEIYPRKLLHFGRQDIFVGGPCFNGAQSTVNVTFGGVQVECQVSSAQQVKCMAPLLTRLGNNEVILTNNNIVYRSFVVVVDIDDKIVGDGQIDTKETSDPDSAFTLNWAASQSCAKINDKIQFKGFQMDYILDSVGNILSEQVEKLDYEELPNNGVAVLQPKVIDRSSTQFIRRISLAGYCTGSNSTFSSAIPIARIIYIASLALSSSHCVQWHSQQPSATAMTNIVEEVSQRNPCAPGVTADYPQTTGNFAMDGTCNPTNPQLCTFYHPSAVACYRSMSNVNQRVTQCCYDSKQLLVLGPPGGGALAFADPTASMTDHTIHDMIPYMTCCKFSSLGSCQRYYEKRPSIDSRLFRPPGNGNGGGDPHFSTLDGTSYTFNPIGEFDYLIAGNDVIQARLAQYVDHLGERKQACYFSAFVIKSGQSIRVQVELNSVRLFAFRINGQSVALEYDRWAFGGISLDYQNNATVVIQTDSGIGIEIQILGGVLNAIVSLPASAKGKVSGLLGNWDDMTENDFQLPDGTIIPINSSPADIHDKFGMAWSTTNTSSLFTYPTNLAWSDFQNSSFIPIFTVPPENPACHGDKECNYDAMVTGDINVALSNVAVKERVAEIENFNEEMATYCPATVGVVNGQVAVDVTSASKVSYSVTCNSGFKLTGNEKVTCVNGQYDAIGVCLSAGDSSSAHKTSPMTSALFTIVLAAGVLRRLLLQP